MEGDDVVRRIYTAGNSLALTAGGRTGSRGLLVVTFAACPNPVTTWCFTYWKGYLLE